MPSIPGRKAPAVLTVLILLLVPAAIFAAEEKKAELALPPKIDWTVPQVTPPPPDTLRYGLAEEVRDKPAPLLMAMAREAREEGRFADAVFILRTAQDSPWGRARFSTLLKESLAAASAALAHGARGPLYEDGYPVVKDSEKPILELYLFEPEGSAVLGTNRVRIEVRSLMSKALSEAWRPVLVKEGARLLKEELDRRMPGNLLEITTAHGSRWLGGRFNSEFPRALVAANLELGLLYKDTMDYVLAKHYLNAALGQKAFLDTPDRQYQIRYALAEIAVVEGRMYDYEKMLKEICVDDREYTSTQQAVANRRQQMRDVLVNDPTGLDRMVQLYRLPDDFSQSAHRQLGVFYLQRGNYELALPHFIFATLKTLSRGMELVREERYGYAWSSLKDFLTVARGDAEIMGYLAAAGLYENLNFLAEAVVGSQPGALRTPRQIWTVLAATPEAGPIRELARDRLAKLAR